MHQNATKLANFLRSLSDIPGVVVLFVFVTDTTLAVGIVIGFIIKVAVKFVVVVVVKGQLRTILSILGL